MKTILAAALAAPIALASLNIAQAADTRAYPESDGFGGVRIGTLECDIGGGVGYVLGSSKELACVFRSSVGSKVTENYTGTIRKLGVDLGFTTRGRLVWAVFAPTAGYHRGSMAGVYEGATLEASVGAGVGANVLVGGTSGSIHLQVVSLTGQIGLNLAATGTSVTLAPAN